jgi:DNA processing protein
MNKAILFKIIQRQNKFRNPKALLAIPEKMEFTSQEYHDAQVYLERLISDKINYTFPGDMNYPLEFFKMLEPPLFLEYLGAPVWKNHSTVSVVGSRKIHALSVDWMKTELGWLVKNTNLSVVSGGAIGVDILSHAISIFENKPTIAVLPSGLSNLYPSEFRRLAPALLRSGGAIVSEFERNNTAHKSHFFYRNRLIAALGGATLVVQAQERSGTLLTVHHALQNGKPVLVVPSHPSLSCFRGNQILLQDGASAVYNGADVFLYLQTEMQFAAQQQMLFSV